MSVTDAELCQGLAATLRRPVTLLSRRPWPYVSSVPIEELNVAGHPSILFKELTPVGGRSRPAFMIDPLREVEAYTRLLDGLDAPRCYGAVVKDHRIWLFLEVVDGVPLWQAHGTEAWEQAARWLARLHSAPPPRGEHLVHYNGAFFERWVDRADVITPGGLPAGVRAAALEAVRRLESWPVSFVHGEFYASNVLVAPRRSSAPASMLGPRIRPVDWETAGVGPAVLDLAALTAGDWEADSRNRIIGAYLAALRAVRDDFDPALDAARLLIALQWLGWSPGWSAPTEHRHDWAGDVRELVRRITE